MSAPDKDDKPLSIVMEGAKTESLCHSSNLSRLKPNQGLGAHRRPQNVQKR
jgi:hypothetical protein